MIQILRVCTVLTLALCAWVASVWSHEGRVCWKDTSLAALHWEEDGVRVAIPQCSPLSYLFQPSLNPSQIRLINRALRQVSQVTVLLERLDFQRTHKIHLVVSSDTEIDLRKEIMKSYMERRVRAEAQQLELASRFYANYLRSYASREAPVWSPEAMTETLSSGSDVEISALVLSLYFEQLSMRQKSKFLRQFWREQSIEEFRVESAFADLDSFRRAYETYLSQMAGVDSRKLMDISKFVYGKVKNTYRARRTIPVQVQSDSELSQLDL